MALTAKLSNSGVSFPIGSPGEAVLSGQMINTCHLREKLKIGTWNVRTMAQIGNIQNATKEMKRMQVDIMGISEMRWPAAGTMNVDEHRVFYSGTQDGTHQKGVGIIVTNKIAHSVTNFTPISERVMLIQMNARPVNLNIVQVYAPTTDGTDEEVVEFYRTVEKVLIKLKKQEMTLVMGDFNSKLGAGHKTEFIGTHGLGDRNERGDMLEQFVESHKLVVLNTQFKQPPRRLYTWKAPKDKPEKVIRNQIDFILINKRYRNSCKNMKTFPGADIKSDHVPVIGEFQIVLKKIRKKIPIKVNLRQLKESRVKEVISEELKARMKELDSSRSVEEQLSYIKESVEDIKKTYLKEEQRVKKRTWMTEDILDLMEHRRINKNNVQEYKRINNIIRQEIRKAKDQEQINKCEEIEALQAKFDEFNVHRKVKEVTGQFKKKDYGKLLDEEGNIAIDLAEKKHIWKKYLDQLFHDERVEILQEETNTEQTPDIMQAEVEIAVKQMKERKAVGPDNIEAEFLKLLEDDGIKKITKIFNDIYRTGEIPREWLISEFIALPKKTAAKKCEEYRTISLMSHLLKVFLKVIHRRIYTICEEQISQTQFGFVNAVGTREALFAVQVLIQRCRDVNCDVYLCLIDYQKAFDRVRHTQMIEILRKTGINERDLRIINNLYWNQKATLRIDGEHTENIEISRGVRQGCVLSPILFNIYSEQIFKEALEDTNEGIPINGERLNNIRYADDTIVLADNLRGLQELVNKIAAVSREYGLEINSKKTKFMIVSKTKIQNVSLSVNNEPLERVAQTTYLGTNINENWEAAQEIRIRIAKAKAAFNKMGNLFRSHDISLQTKERLLKCYIFSVLLYGVEAWTLNEETIGKIEAFEMWMYRRILRISWTEHITNEEVLRRMGKKRELMSIVKIRKLQYLGHLMRNNSKYALLQVIMQGKVEGKRGRGRRRISWLHNLRKWFGKTSTELFRIAVNKVKIAMMVANIRNG
uniref:Craniofacial development protein 2 n=1 Tax=Cacopsylla melanoneura TaxID=428564 RepID=A0A8D8Q4X5_9HEMI